MFSSTTNTINNIPLIMHNKSDSSSSTNKCYNYPGPFKSERKWAQDVMSNWVKEWINK
jgi:hypothetical protein